MALAESAQDCWRVATRRQGMAPFIQTWAPTHANSLSASGQHGRAVDRSETQNPGRVKAEQCAIPSRRESIAFPSILRPTGGQHRRDSWPLAVQQELETVLNRSTASAVRVWFLLLGKLRKYHTPNQSFLHPPLHSISSETLLPPSLIQPAPPPTQQPHHQDASTKFIYLPLHHQSGFIQICLLAQHEQCPECQCQP